MALEDPCGRDLVLGEEQVVGAEGLGGGVEEPGQKAVEQEDPGAENLSDVSCPD